MDFSKESKVNYECKYYLPTVNKKNIGVNYDCNVDEISVRIQEMLS